MKLEKQACASGSIVGVEPQPRTRRWPLNFFAVVCAVCALLSMAAQQPNAAASARSMPAVTGKRVTTPAVSYIDVQVGTGDIAQPGKQITMSLAAWNDDGTLNYEFPVRFPLVRSFDGMPGWMSSGLKGMRVGGRRRVFVPEAEREEFAKSKPNTVLPLIEDWELMAINDAPGLEETTTFIGALLKAHGGSQQEMTETMDNGVRLYLYRTIESVDSLLCSTAVKSNVAAWKAAPNPSLVMYQLHSYDPLSVRVAPTRVTGKWRELTPTFTVTADDTTGKQDFSQTIDTEENAKRLQRSLVHALQLCGASKSSF